MVAGLAAQGLMQGTTAFEQFPRDAQTVLDSGDPVNYIAAAATQRLIDTAALARMPAPSAAGPVMNGAGFRSYVSYVVGDHGSIIDPTVSVAVTTEMQAQAITLAGAPVPPIPKLSFAGFPATTPGTAVLVLNPAVIQP